MYVVWRLNFWKQFFKFISQSTRESKLFVIKQLGYQFQVQSEGSFLPQGCELLYEDPLSCSISHTAPHSVFKALFWAGINILTNSQIIHTCSYFITQALFHSHYWIIYIFYILLQSHGDSRKSSIKSGEGDSVNMADPVLNATLSSMSATTARAGYLQHRPGGG